MQDSQIINSNQPEKKYRQNGNVVLRQEFDEWGILFDADSGEGFAVDPVAIFIWQQLDGQKAVADICNLVKQNFAAPPEDDMLAVDCTKFINLLAEHGLVSIEM